MRCWIYCTWVLLPFCMQHYQPDSQNLTHALIVDKKFSKAFQTIRTARPQSPSSMDSCGHEQVSPLDAISSSSHANGKPPQEISDRRIDAGKLIELLSAKFPDCYQIRVVRNVYNISAPADLSLSDIAQCRV
ncbi:hypothetical protein F5883DRAFT_570477 [Diaporthe sp. PMI_573]|nr:hypothetical protein F5883DRAFT_570477 [Diaporthaceae sp. PMI_573]